MRTKDMGRLFGGIVVLGVFLGCAAAVAAPAREYVAYWRTTYQELVPTPENHAAKAQQIFKRLVQVAGKRPGVMPQLLIIARDPWDIALPIALRDGWIVLSKGALEKCYREPAYGDDRLAFVLAHELAHQLNDDLWHVRFAQAFEAGKNRQRPPQPELRGVLEEVQRAAYDVERVRERELRADEYGLRLATLAGFNPQAIVAASPPVNFFAEWVQGLSVSRLPGLGQVDPTPEQRHQALLASLRLVADNASLFHIGLWSYYAGNFPQAIQAFDAFRPSFPSREVFHNLATSHHQLALQAYRAWQPDGKNLPFQLSLALDPLTHASRSYLQSVRGQAAPPEVVFREHLEQAVRWYEEALAQDSQYIPAALNIGAALVLRGAAARKPGPHADFAIAVARLSAALDSAPQSPEILNNLGVALWYEERPAHARARLTQAHAQAPTYAAPLYNLEAMARAENQPAEAQRYQDLYTQCTAVRPSVLPSAGRPETLEGVTLSHVVPRDVPAGWGPSTRSDVVVDGKPLALVTYPIGVMALIRDGEIVMLMARDGYQKPSAGGIALGSREADVLARYGAPSRRQELLGGQSLAYDAQRIAFQVRDGRVVSWLIF